MTEFVLAKEQKKERDRARKQSIQTSISSIKRGFTTAEAAAYTGDSESKLRQMRMESSDEEGPAFIKRGRKVIYLREALDAYLEGVA